MKFLEFTTSLQQKLNLIFNNIQSKLQGPTTQKILANIGWLTIERLLRMGLGFGVGVWVSRYLGPEKLGLYSYAIAFVTIFGTVATLGLERIVVRDLVRFPEREDRLLGTALILKFLAAIITYLLLLPFSYFLNSGNPEAHFLIGIVGIGIVFQSLDPIDFWFQSKVQSKYTAYAKSAAFTLISFIKILLIIFNAPLTMFAWAGVAEVGITSLGLVIAYLRMDATSKKLSYCYTTARHLLKDSSPFILSGLMIMIYMRIDQIMVTRISGEYEAGLYSAAVVIAEAWNFVPLIVVPSVLPNMVTTLANNEEFFYQKMQFLYNAIAAFFYAIAIPTTLLSGWIIPTIFGADYADASPMLAVLIWSSLFLGLGIARSSFLTAKNWAYLHFFAMASGCVINLSLNFAFIPAFGGLAAAVTTLISYGFAAYLSCFFSKKLIRNGQMMTAALSFRWRWRGNF